MAKPPFKISHVGRPYPDNWPWSHPHRHPEDDCRPFEGFDLEVPYDGTAVSDLANSIREAKTAFSSLLSVPAVFACDVEDGDIVIPLPCACDDDDACNELMETLARLKKLPDAIWVPAFRDTSDSAISAYAAVDVTNYDPPFYGVAYKHIGRVMVGPVVVHPRFRFHTGDKVYADKNGDLTIEKGDSMVGVCLAPGAVYLLQYASAMKTALEDLYGASIADTIKQIVQKGLDGDKIGATAAGTTTERNLETRFGDWVNVKDFGAKGDGTTDDTAAINRAIARAQQLGSNVCLFIPVGTYKVSTLPNVPCYGPGSLKVGSKTYGPFELLFKVGGVIERGTDGRFLVNFSKMSTTDTAQVVEKVKPSVTTIVETTTNEVVKNILSGGDDDEGGGGGFSDLLSEEEITKLVQRLIQQNGGGGITTDPNGKLKIDFSKVPQSQLQTLLSAIVKTGGGLSVGSDGKLYFDAESMDTTVFKKLMKTLRLPTWLTRNTYFYVDSSSSAAADTDDDGRGLSASKPYRTLQYAINDIATNYNLSTFNAYVMVKAGTTYSGQLRLPEFTASGGNVWIRSWTGTGNEESTTPFIVRRTNPTVTSSAGSAGVACTGGSYSISDIRLEIEVADIADTRRSIIGAIATGNSSLTLYNHEIHIKLPTSVNNLPMTKNISIVAYNAFGGIVHIAPGATDSEIEIITDGVTKGITTTIFASNGANSTLYLDGSNTAGTKENLYIKCNGFTDCANASSKGMISSYGVGSTVAILRPKMASGYTANGQRYRCVSGGAMNMGYGADFFPGSEAGTAEASTYSWYK